MRRATPSEGLRDTAAHGAYRPPVSPCSAPLDVDLLCWYPSIAYPRVIGTSKLTLLSCRPLGLTGPRRPGRHVAGELAKLAGDVQKVGGQGR